MLRKVYLHGALARFGKMHRFHIDSPHEAISALENQCDGFTEAIRQGRFSMATGAADQLTTLGGAGLGEAAGFFGSKLLGGAATWLILSSASDSLAPQIHAPAGTVESDVIAASASSGEGTPIPLVYGMVRVTEPPVISAGLSVAIEKLT